MVVPWGKGRVFFLGEEGGGGVVGSEGAAEGLGDGLCWREGGGEHGGRIAAIYALVAQLTELFPPSVYRCTFE